MAMYSVMNKEELEKAADAIKRIEEAMGLILDAIGDVEDADVGKKLELVYVHTLFNVRNNLSFINPEAVAIYHERLRKGWG